MSDHAGERVPPIVFPESLPVWVTSNHRRSAELRVYEALRSQLEWPWRVFYSRPWLGLEPDGTERDGEADFVLAHPDLGMLVLEVKGGRIGRDAQSERWYSIDRDDNKFTIKNPVHQARTSKHRLLEQLRRLEGWNGRRITARHGVIFPDCVRPQDDLGPDMPPWLFAGIDEMGKLGSWVEKRLEQHLAGEALEPDELNDDGVELLSRHLARSFVLERPPAASLLADDEAIRILTDQQVRVLDLLDSVARIAIPGPAGTGKTTLAIEKARRLARAGRRTLLTCYNRPLASQLRREIGPIENLVVTSFHSLCVELAERAGIRLPRPQAPDQGEYYGRILPEALQESLRMRPEERFEGVVIDEGQDFPEAWFPAVESLLADCDDSCLFVFFDDNQMVFGNTPSIAHNIPTGGLRLSRILRNGRLIVREIARLLPKPYSVEGPEGQPIEWREAHGSLSASDVSDALDNLIRQRRLSPSHIAIIVPDQRFRDEIVQDSHIGRWRVSDAEAPPANAVVCDSVRRFKGLERPAVILVEPERLIGVPEALYVSLTRARVLLVLLASAGRLAQLRLLLD